MRYGDVWIVGEDKLVKFGLLMRRMALDWTLSRRWGGYLGAPPMT